MAIQSSKPPVALIAGPTASGKSALALLLAETVDGVIINADSAQIYRDLPILSAAPAAGDLGRAEHRLYGILDGSDPCSAADWAALARKEIENVHSNGKIPILVGGTGLYLRTVLQGIAPVPAIDPEVRRAVRSRSVEENRARLGEHDPEAAGRLKPADTARIARALEVVLSTGRTLREWQERKAGGIRPFVDLYPLILLPPREWLYRRCDERFAKMMNDGAADEVQALLDRDLPPDVPVMRAIGVREIAAWLQGTLSQEGALTAGQQATRRYAKRQYTWFSHQPPPEWRRIQEPLEGEAVTAALHLLSPPRPGMLGEKL